MNESEPDQFVVIGDSIIHNAGNMGNVLVISYRGDTLEDLGNHVKHNNVPWILGKAGIIIHSGTNDLYTRSVEEMLHMHHSLFNLI